MYDIKTKMDQYKKANYYLEQVIVNIEQESLNPKIAGMTLDKAFVNLSISFVIACVSATITYWIDLS